MGYSRSGLLSVLILASGAPGFAQEKGQEENPHAAAGKPILVLDTGGHTAPIHKVLFSRDDKQVLTVSQDKTVRIWDVQTGQVQRVLRPPIGEVQAGELLAGALSPDGKTLAVGGWGLKEGKDRVVGIHLIKLADGSLRTFTGHTDSVIVLAFSPDGKTLASGSEDKTVRLWDVEGGTCRHVLAGHNGPVVDLAFAPNGKRLITVGPTQGGGTGLFWSVETGRPDGAFQDQSPRVHGVAWSPDGKIIVVERSYSGPDERDAVAYEANGKRLRFLPETKDSIWGLAGFRKAPESKGTLQVVYNRRGRQSKDRWDFGVNVLDLASGKSTQVLEISEGAARTVVRTALSADGKWAATSGGDNNQTWLWKTDAGEKVYRLEGQGRPAFKVAWGSDKDNKTTVAWGVDRTAGSPNPPLSGAFNFAELTLSSNPDPKKFQGPLTRLGAQSLWHNNETRLHINAGDRRVATLAIPVQDGAYTLLPGKKVAAAAGNTILLYDPGKANANNPSLVFHDSKELHRLVPHGGKVWSLAPSPDGRYLASVSADQTLRITAVDDPNPLVTLFVVGSEWVAWTPQGYYAASPGGERLMGWQVNNGTDKLASFYPAGQFRASLYRPDIIGRLLAEGSVAKALAAAGKERGVEKTEVVEVDEVLPPRVTLTARGLEEGKTTVPTVEVEATATGTGKHPVVALQLLLDGRPYEGGKGLRRVAAKPGATVNEKWTVTLPEGEHTLRVVARSEASAGLSDDVEVTVVRPVARKHLYLLAVGINAYANPGLKLNCAVNDARELEKTFKERSKGIFDVEARVLTDREATREEIVKALSWLKQSMGPQDQAVVFFAGHGEKDGKSFYLLPQDADAGNLKATGISGDLLKQHLADLPGKVLLLLDACHSGAIGKVINEMARDLADDDCGVVVMCAALGKETAGEADGHGFFCRALIEALEGKGQKNKADGCVYQHHLEQYVIDRVQELSNKEQHPTTAKPTLPPFPLAKP